jgi:uncharacterized membrane protein
MGVDACRWTSDGQTIVMGYYSAWGANYDGTVIVGPGVRWKAGEPELALDFQAEQCSDDGTVIVGYQPGAGGSQTWNAILWDQVHGTRQVRDVLTESGIDMSGWHLRRAYEISGDGTVMVGTGDNPAGQYEWWVARIPEPDILGLMGLAAMIFLRPRMRA